MKPTLGIDFGNVICKNDSTEMVPGIRESLRQLKMLFFDRIYVISRVDDDESGQRNLQYLKNNYFIPDFITSEDKVVFCRKRKDKGPIAEDLKITHFVDDRTECLHFMKTVKHRYALNPTEDQLKDFPPEGMTVCGSWLQIVAIIQHPPVV